MSSEMAPSVSTADPSEALSAPTICEAFQRTVRHHAERPAVRMPGGSPSFTWREYGERVETLARGLAALGLGRGETVALQLSNRPEFHFVDMAALHLGATPFSIYNTSSPEQIVDRLETADCRVFVTELAFLGVVEQALAAYGRIEHVIVVDGGAAGALSLEEVAAAGDAGFAFEEAWAAVEPSDVATLIFTSGTTGPPKAVVLSHAGVMGTLRSLSQVIPLPRHAMVSFLPMAHIGERMFSHYMTLPHGATSTCCPAREQIFQGIRESRPDVPFMVPRLWEKVASVLRQKIAAMPDDLRAAVEDGLERGLARVRAEQAGDAAEVDDVAAHDRAVELVREHVLPELGLDRVSIGFMGGAPCPRDLVEFLVATGLPIREAYGLTEATGFAAIFPTVDRYRIGTVGLPLPGVELRVAGDAEVLLRSPMNMVGYLNDPERTREAIDAEGWLHTGDIGVVDGDGFVRIVDRKKDIIINAYGKNMSPAGIEAKIVAESLLIGTVAVIGDGRPCNVALLTLEPEAAAAFARGRGLPGSSVAEWATDPVVLAEIGAAVDRANARLSRVEQVRRYRVLGQAWAPDSDELTPTMKLKRRQIAAKYAADIASLYEE